MRCTKTCRLGELLLLEKLLPEELLLDELLLEGLLLDELLLDDGLLLDELLEDELLLDDGLPLDELLGWMTGCCSTRLLEDELLLDEGLLLLDELLLEGLLDDELLLDEGLLLDELLLDDGLLGLLLEGCCSTSCRRSCWKDCCWTTGCCWTNYFWKDCCWKLLDDELLLTSCWRDCCWRNCCPGTTTALEQLLLDDFLRTIRCSGTMRSGCCSRNSCWTNYCYWTPWSCPPSRRSQNGITSVWPRSSPALSRVPGPGRPVSAVLARFARTTVKSIRTRPHFQHKSLISTKPFLLAGLPQRGATTQSSRFLIDRNRTSTGVGLARLGLAAIGVTMPSRVATLELVRRAKAEDRHPICKTESFDISAVIAHAKDR